MVAIPWWSFVIILLFLSLAIIILLYFHKKLPQQLVFFLASGFMVNHWLHVWCYRLQDFIYSKDSKTELNGLFAFSIDWKLSLILALVWFLAVYILIRIILSKHEGHISIGFVSILGIIALVGFEVIASSVPKISLDASILAIFLLGLTSWRYFLSYQPGSKVESTQLQSDALTSFGIMFSFLALWLPACIAFGSFLFNYYQSQGSVGLQLQMTRYAGGILFSLFGFAIVIIEILRNLISARRGIGYPASIESNYDELNYLTKISKSWTKILTEKVEEFFLRIWLYVKNTLVTMKKKGKEIMQKTSNNTCLQCHFLIRKHANMDVSEHKDPLKREEREKILQDDFNWIQKGTNLACYMQVWDEAKNPEDLNLRKELKEKNRNNFCYFWQYRLGMLLLGGKELQKREDEFKKYSKEIMYTRIAIWIASVALIADLIFRFFSKI